VSPWTGALAMRGVSAAKPHSSETRWTADRWASAAAAAARGGPLRQRPMASAVPGRQGNLTKSVRLSGVTALRRLWMGSQPPAGAWAASLKAGVGPCLGPLHAAVRQHVREMPTLFKAGARMPRTSKHMAQTKVPVCRAFLSEWRSQTELVHASHPPEAGVVPRIAVDGGQAVRGGAAVPGRQARVRGLRRPL